VYRFDSRGAFLPKFLGGIIVLFIGILIAAYYISKQANPVMLDEKGNLRDSHAAVHR
jgi:hypothetical protein